MKRSATTIGIIVSLFLMMAFIESRAEAQSTTQGATVHMVVSEETRNGAQMANVSMQDVTVNEANGHRNVTEWTPAAGENAGLDLFILIDDSSSWRVSTQINEVRSFIMEQPAITFIGVGYMHNGSSQIVQKLTADHASAAKALRLPFGSSAGQASPYFSVEDLIKGWQVNPAHPRREIVLITNGIDLYSPGSADPYLDAAIQQAQRAGIIIYSIYAPGGGHFGHSYWRFNWGQNDLSELSDETGGESYNLSMVSAESFKPYFDDITARLGHQYLLAFLAKPEAKAGMQTVKLTTEIPNVDLVSADRIYVPSSSQE